jgi:transglutaminase-like putative cysteine protease
VEVSEWKDIDTAPRDGSIILLGNYGSEPRPAYYGRALKAFNACAEPHFPWVFLDATNGINAMSDDEFGPTHWMPLPAPPSSPNTEVQK